VEHCPWLHNTRFRQLSPAYIARWYELESLELSKRRLPVATVFASTVANMSGFAFHNWAGGYDSPLYVSHCCHVANIHYIPTTGALSNFLCPIPAKEIIIKSLMEAGSCFHRRCLPTSLFSFAASFSSSSAASLLREIIPWPTNVLLQLTCTSVVYWIARLPLESVRQKT